MLADEGDGGLERGAGAEDGGYAMVHEGLDVLGGDGAAEDEEDVFRVLGAKELGDAGDDGIVGAGEDGEADAVDVFLDGGGDDHLGGLTEASVDNLHACVAEGAGDDLGAAVMAVEAGFGDEDADGGRVGHVLPQEWTGILG